MFMEILKQLFTFNITPGTLLPGGYNPVGDNPFLALVIITVFAFILGAVMAFVYNKTQRDEAVSMNFTLTVAMLPAIIAVLIYLIGDNIARTFTMAGVFALVRFRSVQGDPKDISCIVFTMGVGLAAGIKLLVYASLVMAFFLAFMIVAYLVKVYHGNRRTHCRVKITVPENMNWDKSFEEVLHKYTKRFSLVRVMTIEYGAFFELMYDVTLLPDINEKDLIDDLRERNGNLTIQYNLLPDTMYQVVPYI